MTIAGISQHVLKTSYNLKHSMTAVKTLTEADNDICDDKYGLQDMCMYTDSIEIKE